MAWLPSQIHWRSHVTIPYQTANTIHGSGSMVEVIQVWMIQHVAGAHRGRRHITAVRALWCVIEYFIPSYGHDSEILVVHFFQSFDLPNREIHSVVKLLTHICHEVAFPIIHPVGFI